MTSNKKQDPSKKKREEQYNFWSYKRAGLTRTRTNINPFITSKVQNLYLQTRIRTRPV